MEIVNRVLAKLKKVEAMDEFNRRKFKGQGWYLTYQEDIVAGPYSDWYDVTGELLQQHVVDSFSRIYLDKNGMEMKREGADLRQLAEQIKGV